jgi:hypothetical protein
MKPVHQTVKPIAYLSTKELHIELTKLLQPTTKESEKLISISVSLIAELFKHFNQRHEAIVKELIASLVEKMDDHIREVIQSEVETSIHLLTGNRVD